MKKLLKGGVINNLVGSWSGFNADNHNTKISDLRTDYISLTRKRVQEFGETSLFNRD